MRVVVFGLGKFGTQVAKTLVERGVEVVGIDKAKKITETEELKQTLTSIQNLDCTTEEGLQGVDLENIDVAVIAIGEDYEAATTIAAFLKEKKEENENMENMKIIARAGDAAQARVLKALELSRVVRLEEDAGIYVANLIKEPHFTDRIYIGPDGSSCKIKVGNKKLIGKTLGLLKFGEKFKVYVYRIVGKGGEEKYLIPPADYKIEKGDILEIMGKSDDIDNFKKKFSDEITT